MLELAVFTLHPASVKWRQFASWREEYGRKKKLVNPTRAAMPSALTAETVIVALEDAEDYQAFEAAVIADFGAESAVKLLLASAGNEPELDQTKNIGDVFLRLAALPTFPLDRLSRYEYMLWR